MKNYLILQILGSSDIRVDSEEGTRKLEACYTLEDVNQAQKWNDQEFLNEIERVDFPLIRQVWEEQKNEANLHFGIILTNQVAWMQDQNESGEGWNDIVTSDGYWWRNILAKWCQQQGIDYYTINLDVDSNVAKGAADWEGMAEKLNPLLNGLIQFNSRFLLFKPIPEKIIKIDKIIVQHSSGTPALSSALYLWGIEQKLAQREIEFVYISRQESISYFHSGSHWQWRLKVPQIKQLLAIQDFDGAYVFLAEHPNKTLQKNCKSLDRAVSFNITDLSLRLNPRDEVIERISIALWSEQAFRERGQWMHWYLRVAGAFELALHCLIEKQGSGAYQWQKKNGKTFLEYTDPHAVIKELDFGIGIKQIVTNLLSNGSVTVSRSQKTYTVTKVPSSLEWNQFQDFYCRNNWKLSRSSNESFIHLRNGLYHSLNGDNIDKLLDAQTTALGSVNHPTHPSEVAIEQLRYIIQLAGLSLQVQQRVQHYENLVEAIKGSL